MRKISIGKKDYTVPGDWNEFTAEQLCFLATVLNTRCTGQEVKLKLLLFCLEARVRRYKRADGNGFSLVLPGGNVWLTPTQLSVLSTVFDFLFSETGKGVELDIRLTRNPFPIHVTNKMTLVGPDDALTNISYGQFIMLQSWQQQMKQDFEKALDSFLSVIWKDGMFTTCDDGKAVWFRDVEPAVKMVMFWYFIGSMRFIQEKFPRVFPGGEGDGYDVFDMQQRIVDEMASGDVTKKDLVKQSLLYDALYTLEMAIERDEKAKQNK
ncbi:hypothetical protein [Parabacteroides sp. AM08-6]|uniref:hypothetical protein n=1 Tax=Parabacteroides sp. AM08-6 TaxID=2292053 RepID=UPI000EFF89FF|nr:hypothetical protein [Parabacteroides sp. AM08-6]RHJ83543.1 hypothetical protein DW103_07410 [Parabacteroides sp. AM08-6]